MSFSRTKKTVEPAAELQVSLQSFRQDPEDQGLSLEELSTAYAELLNRGSTPYEEPPAPAKSETPAAPDCTAAMDDPEPSDIDCDLTPKSILEAIIFVGNAKNEPLISRRVASLMRGVRPQEIDELIRELNEGYAADGCAYEIVSVSAGYALRLREEFAWLRDSFYGRVREAKLTQAAIDVLAIVAYRQPIKREEVDQLRGQPSGGMLSQLLRRGLLRLDRGEGKPKTLRYRTTDRFLQLFGLESLAELPQSQDVLPDEPGM